MPSNQCALFNQELDPWHFICCDVDCLSTRLVQWGGVSRLPPTCKLSLMRGFIGLNFSVQYLPCIGVLAWGSSKSLPDERTALDNQCGASHDKSKGSKCLMR